MTISEREYTSQQKIPQKTPTYGQDPKVIPIQAELSSQESNSSQASSEAPPLSAIQRHTTEITLKAYENPHEKLRERARAFMEELGFFYDGEFPETEGTQVEKFSGEEDRNGRRSWLKTACFENKYGVPGMCITFGRHDGIEGHKRITKTFWTHEDSWKGLHPDQKEAVRKQREQQQCLAKEKAKRDKIMADELADKALDRFSAAKHQPLKEAKTYFSKKGLSVPYDIHTLHWECVTDYTNGQPEEKWVAIVAIRDNKGKIRAIQELWPEKRSFGSDENPRNKNYVGKVSGCFALFGDLRNENGFKILVAEGVATALTLFQATYTTVVSAMDCGNLPKVIKELRIHYSKSEIIICADNDHHQVNNPNVKGNPGLESARKTALEFQCKLAVPEFPEGEWFDSVGKPRTDADDLRQLSGNDAIKELIERAKLPEIVEKSLSKTNSMQTDDSDDEREGNVEDSATIKLKEKARADARRRALMQSLPHDDIVKDIRKQYPALGDQADDIASKAIQWAKKYQPSCEVEVSGIPKTVVDMVYLDERFAQLEAPGQPCVTIHRSDAQPISTKDFNQRLSGNVVLVGVDDKGQPKYVAASNFWTGNTNKYVYKDIVFTNKSVGNNTYNLFTGFGVTQKEGKCDKILAHIQNVICAGDKANYDAFIKLLAWQIQNIGQPSRIITALKSKTQQVGKGCLLEDILTVIYGNAGIKTSDLGQIITRFNDTIRGKAFIFLDEALFAGDRKAADAVKSLATTTRQPVESKGIPTVQFPIAVNLFLATNHDDAAHLEESDARYWILEVSDHRAKDFEYFKELYAEINGGGREAFMFYLLHFDVCNFVPARDVPIDNAAKDAMIRNSINPYDARKWLEQCCENELILGQKPILDQPSTNSWEIWREGAEYDNGIFWVAYLEWQKTVKSPIGPKPTAPNKFGELLNKAGIEQRNTAGRRRTLPNPKDCLKAVTTMIDKVRK